MNASRNTPAALAKKKKKRTNLPVSFLSVCRRSQVCWGSSDSGERQPRRWQDLPVLQRECYGWRACWQGHARSHRTALQSRRTHIGTHPCRHTHTRKLALTQKNSDPHKGSERQRRTASTHTLCGIASVSGKTLDGRLSGFHNGRFQGLLSVIIFSLEASGLCCVWYNRPPKTETWEKC